MNDLNNKYKQCLLMCKQLSTQEERSTYDEMKGVPFTADKLLYHHAIELCLNAASLEFFGKPDQVGTSYLLYIRVSNGVVAVLRAVHSSTNSVPQLESTGDIRE